MMSVAFVQEDIKSRLAEEKLSEILRSGVRRDLLELLSREQLSTSELARRLGISKQLADYHLKVMESAGVVERCNGVWRAALQVSF